MFTSARVSECGRKRKYFEKIEYRSIVAFGMINKPGTATVYKVTFRFSIFADARELEKVAEGIHSTRIYTIPLQQVIHYY